MAPIFVEKSHIHGKGVFANQDFAAGERILAIDDSHVVDDPSKLTAYQNKYQCDWLKNKIVLMQPPERYINHSCNPNSYVKTIRGIRTLLAMKDIQKGEEITYDYAINGYYESADPCHCGSKKCRQILNCDFFQLPEALQQKYLPYLDNWFVKEFKEKVEELKRGKDRTQALIL